MMPKPLIVLVARQRTGTTALSESLGGGPAIFSAGEVFHHKWDSPAGEQEKYRLQRACNYFEYRLEKLREEPELNIPTLANQRTLLHGFLNRLSESTDKPFVLISVKYNSVHHFEPFYSTPGVSSHFLFLVRELNAAIIHLKRPAYFDRYCSGQMASQSGVWHAERGKGLADEPVTLEIDCRAALRDMQESARLDAEFERYLQSYNRRLVLKYGYVFAGQGLSPGTADGIDALVGARAEAAPVPLSKLVPPLWKTVSNREEVMTFFDSTPFGEVVRNALTPPGHHPLA